jgi:hypothetical protein
MFDWKEFVEFARWIEQQAAGVTQAVNEPQPTNVVNVEAALRTVLSRSYYGAFGHASVYAEAKLSFQPMGDQGDHARLLDTFKKRPKFGGVFRRLSDLRIRRNKADYERDPNPPVQSAAAARSALKEADDIVQQLKL